MASRATRRTRKTGQQQPSRTNRCTFCGHRIGLHADIFCCPLGKKSHACLACHKPLAGTGNHGFCRPSCSVDYHRGIALPAFDKLRGRR